MVYNEPHYTLETAMQAVADAINFLVVLVIVLAALAIGAYFGYTEALDHVKDNYIVIPKP